MNDSKQLRDLVESNEELSKRIDELTKAISDDAHAYSIYSKAKDSFKKWVGLWIGFLAILLTVLGIKTYNEAIEILSNHEAIINRIVETASPKIEKEVIALLTGKFEKTLERNRESLEKDMANINALAEQNINEIKEKFNSRLKTISENINKDIEPIEIKEYSVRSGYAFYGIKSNGSWKTRYFGIIGDEPAVPPRIGDSVEALSNVNIRKDYITLTDTGWTNAPTTGVIQINDILDVTEVKEVTNGYYWIKFDNRRHEELTS